MLWVWFGGFCHDPFYFLQKSLTGDIFDTIIFKLWRKEAGLVALDRHIGLCVIHCNTRYLLRWRSTPAVNPRRPNTTRCTDQVLRFPLPQRCNALPHNSSRTWGSQSGHTSIFTGWCDTLVQMFNLLDIGTRQEDPWWPVVWWLPLLYLRLRPDWGWILTGASLLPL
jgi:hypothetical protein